MILILASALYLMPIAMPAAWSNVAAPPPNEGWILLQDSVKEEYRFAYQDYWQFVDNHGHWADLLKHFEKKNGKEKATATFFQFYLGREDLAIQQEWQHTVMGWDGHKPCKSEYQTGQVPIRMRSLLRRLPAKWRLPRIT